MKKIIIVILGLLSVILVGTLDIYLGAYISIYLLYVFPIVLISYFSEKYSGLLVAISSAVMWTFVDWYLSKNLYHASSVAIEFFSRMVIFLVISIMAYQSRRNNDQLKRMAYTDQKTGAYNYRAFLDLAARALSFANRQSLQVYIAYFDMDKFKKVNDTYGHSRGDEVLVAFSQIALDQIRASDIFARIGGDEFVLCVSGINEMDLNVVLGRIAQKFKDEMLRQGLEVSVTFGYTNGLNRNEDLEALIHEADVSMYQHKDSKRA
ncbi:MAG: hypothetical protein BGO41_09900 [Clostridiales bacterium 38-18]|nr:MAG: hypothetical protein BGO41_09900 [Clostridiales bacterium 38-18]